MSCKDFCLLAAAALLGSVAMGQDTLTRGIGAYPGRTEDFHGPTMVRDNTLRNLALHRAAYASASLDYNLTAQLATDGMVTRDMPPTLTVSTREGRLPLRDKEKPFDGNPHSSVTVMGGDNFLRMDWTGMRARADRLRLRADVAYRPQEATAGYAIVVEASGDGSRWQVIGSLKGSALPGVATRQMVSSDPNKREDKILLPLRKVDEEIALRRPGSYRHLRVSLTMRGAAYWRVYEMNDGWLPSAHFGIAFAARVADGRPTWLYVDLGAEASISHVRLHWIHKAHGGKLQLSDDARLWRTVAALPADSRLDQTLPAKGRGRYVRLLMEKPGDSRLVALSEMEVWGRGGLVARANDRRDIHDWELRRDGDSQWIKATVPGTVLTSYMNVGAVPDNRYANQMRQISESFFQSDFWYRATVDAPAAESGRHTWLNFDGINWKAEVFLNHRPLGRIDGAFTRARFDVTNRLHKGRNLLEVRIVRNAHFGAVKVKNTVSTDLNGGVLGADNPTFHASIGWDWITSTPGRDAGIWNDVYLSSDRGLGVSDPLVTTRLSLPDTLASMTPAVVVDNADARAKTAEVSGWIGGIRFAKTVTLRPGERREVAFTPDEFPQLSRRRMRLWWPNGYGEPYLYDAGFEVRAQGDSSPSAVVRYKAGIRQMGYEGADGALRLYINGKRFIPLGGNWGFSETNLNYRAREYDAAVAYHRDMHCNMIRNWVGQTGDDEFYDACDRYGIVVWQDFWLANPWDGPDPYDETMFLANSRDLISRIRRHASVGIYVGRNEGYPPATLDSALRRQVRTLHPLLGYIPSSADDGVSGHGAYQLMPIDYYFTHQSGKLHSERGLPAVPTYESLCRMLPPEGRWPIGLAWAQHDFTMQGAQSGQSFVSAVTAHFGPARDARQFCEWAQWVNYDGYRAMYEGAARDRMGLLIWMSHPCWPTTVWQTYDYYLEPTAAYFGVKKACEPLHVQFNPVTKGVEVVNIAAGTHRGLTLTAQTLTASGQLIRQWADTIDTHDDQTLSPLTLDLPDEEVYFVRLRLNDGARVVSENTYVESRTPGQWQALCQLPKTRLGITQEFHREGPAHKGTVMLTNDSDTPALMVRLNLKGSDGGQILPVVYSDNYLHLMPGERKVVTVSYRDEDGRGLEPHVECSFFNQDTSGSGPQQGASAGMRQ